MKRSHWLSACLLHIDVMSVSQVVADVCIALLMDFKASVHLIIQAMFSSVN